MPVLAAGTLPTQPLLGFQGRFALPAQPPTQLVVFGHGYTNSSESWVNHLQDAANRGAIAVAPDYRGLGRAPDFRGWPAKAGSEDLVAASQFFLKRCPSITEVYLFGISMGGNMTGLALASNAARPDGTRPLFNYWVDVEGVTNWIEEYTGITAVALSGNATAIQAKQDIEAETGGTLVEKPAEYNSRNVVSRVLDIKASNPAGVVVVHGVEDGQVPSDQSVQMSTALRASGIPTDLYGVLRRGQQRDPGHDQTSLAGDAGLGESDPFAGHGWEGSNTHIVIATAFERLWALMDPATKRPSNATFFVDAQQGTTPATDQGSGKVRAASGPSTCTTSGVLGNTTGSFQDGIPGTSVANPARVLPALLLLAALTLAGLAWTRRAPRPGGQSQD